MSDRKQCVEKVWATRTFYPCSKPAKVERDGKWYCGTHDPEAKNARQAKRDAVYAVRDRIRQSEWAIQAAEKLVVAAVLADDPDAIATTRQSLLAAHEAKAKLEGANERQDSD